MEDIKLPDIPVPAVKRVEETVNKYRRTPKLLIPIIATTVEVVALIGLMGLLTLIQADFIIRDINIMEFVGLAAMRLTMLFLSKNVSGRARVNALKRDEEYKELVAAYREEIKGLNYKDLEVYLRTVANPARKIAAYRATIQPKIEKLNADNAKLDLALATLERREKAPFKKWRMAWKKSKIVQNNTQIEKYTVLISDEYIEANYKFLKVKYEVLTVDKFVAVTSNSDGAHGRITVNSETEMTKAIAKGIPLALLISVYLALIGWENTRLGNFDVLTFVLDVLLLSWYFLQGWFFVGGKVVDMIRDALVNKTLFIQQYKDKTTKVG